MSDDLVGRPADDRAVMDAARNIIPNNASINFGGGFGRCHRTNIGDGPHEARAVANPGDVGTEVFGRHCLRRRFCWRREKNDFRLDFLGKLEKLEEFTAISS